MSSQDSEHRKVWEEIDLAESYLVCCKFDDASSLSRSILHRFCSSNSTALIEDSEFCDIAESAGMVFVQSQRELGRTSEIMTELNFLFGSVAWIPGTVFLTGACMQMAEGFSSDLKDTFDEFLGNWKYVEGHAFVLPNEERFSKSIISHILPIETYTDILEVYAVNVLGTLLKDINHAVSWTEKMAMPEEKRKEILSKLRCLSSVKISSSSNSVTMHKPADKTIKSLQESDNFSKKVDSSRKPNAKTLKVETLRSQMFSLFNRIMGNPWWTRSVKLKFGKSTLIIPSGKVFLWGFLFLSILHFLRRKQTTLRRFTGDKIASIRRALFDAWQLAFSVQVNPLAAIQPMPSANTPVSR
ncbi:3-phosphoinositide-dependent protein kinase-1 [Wolffia australiana]